MSAPDATIRDSAWKPMSYIAPSPPTTHSRRSAWPAWSQRAPDAERDRGRVLEQRVRPRHEVRVERIRAAEDRVAAGRGDDPHRLRSVDLAGRGHDHPDRGRLAAAGTGAGAADVAEGVLAEHEVGQRLLVAIHGRRRRQRAEERDVATVPLERRLAARGLVLDLVDHEERVVARAPRRPRRTRRSPCSGRGRRTARRRRAPRRASPAPRRTSGSLRSGGSARRRPRPAAAGSRRTSRPRARACDSGTTQARIALSGQALTQAMQPTHCSISTSGIRGASRLKSRVADVPGGMMLRARPASAGNSASAMPRR